ncbi:MAG: hypothetical protein V1818_00615 [Candidatus Aenigmatarchaeota archaeon]
MRVVLDTNFFVSAVNFKMDLFSELRGHEIYVTEPVLIELEEIAKGNGKDAFSARVSLKLVEEKGLKVLEPKEKEADVSLLELSKQGYAIATQDKRLREKLKRTGSKIIFIRQRKYVVFE